jgi:uncharacterized protein
VLTVILLVASNTFMNLAWYGHLKFRSAPLVAAILASWLIALPEYILQVPANRYGHATESAAGQSTGIHNIWWWGLSAPQLKILQEIISISVFLALNFVYLHEPIKRTDWAAFGLIILAVVVMMYPRVVTSGERRAAMAEQARQIDPPRESL